MGFSYKYYCQNKKNAQPCELIYETRHTWYDISCERRLQRPVRTSSTNQRTPDGKGLLEWSVENQMNIFNDLILTGRQRIKVYSATFVEQPEKAVSTPNHLKIAICMNKTTQLGNVYKRSTSMEIIRSGKPTQGLLKTQ